MALLKRTWISESRSTRIRGPGYCSLKPYIVKTRPPILRFTMPASMSRVSPWARSLIARGRAHGRESVSSPAPGRNGSILGLTPTRPGSIGFRIMGMIMSPEPRGPSPAMGMGSIRGGRALIVS